MSRKTVLTASAQASVTLRLGNDAYECWDGESVLEALLRQGALVPYSCRKGACLACMLKCTGGPVPATAQEGLKESLRVQGYMLACMCRPAGDLDLALPDEDALFVPATVTQVEQLSPQVFRLFLKPLRPFDYRPGQFLNLRRPDGLVRSYSLAGLPAARRGLELHVKRLPGGRMSNWLCDDVRPGTTVGIHGPNGDCFYMPGQPDQPLLLIGSGTGLAPLLGILRDALGHGHGGEIRLYHGSHHGNGLYLQDRLRRIAGRHPNLRYFPCLSGEPAGEGVRPGRADAVAFSDLPDLSGWRVYLCGHPPMVHGARKIAYLAGARLEDICADPFELRELRGKPRP